MRAYSLVIVASLPPPVAGQSLATEILVKAVGAAGVEHRVVDISRDFYTGNRAWQVAQRIVTVAQIPGRAAVAGRFMKTKPTVLYLQLGQSTRALARDLPVLLLARAARWPVVVHVHGGGFRRAFDAAPTPLRAALGPLLAGVARAVALSPSLEPMFAGLVPAERVVPIANAPRAHLTRHASAFRRSALGAPPTVLYLSNLIESKGYLVVLEAARIAASRGLRHRFVLAGAITGETSVHPSDFIAKHRLENVRYVGPAYDQAKVQLLTAADLFVLPTAYPTEGQPIALLEAMQFGLPVVTTRQGGIPDIVEDGVNGALIAPNDATALLEAVERSTRPDSWRRIAEHNRSQSLASYTAERHGANLIALLDEVASEKREARSG